MKVGIFTFLATACRPNYYAVRIEAYCSRNLSGAYSELRFIAVLETFAWFLESTICSAFQLFLFVQQLPCILDESTGYFMDLCGGCFAKSLLLDLLHQGCPVDIKKLCGLCLNQTALLQGLKDKPLFIIFHSLIKG